MIIGINEYEDPIINDFDALLINAQNQYKILSTSYSFYQDDIMLFYESKHTLLIAIAFFAARFVPFLASITFK